MTVTSISRPSQTTLGLGWLQNFQPSDRAAAQLLIDSLEIHDHSKVLRSIGSELRRRLTGGTLSMPAVLIPIRSAEDLPELPDGDDEHVAYVTYDPGLDFPVLPGSEADIGGLSRGLISAHPEAFVSPASDINQLKALQVRTLVLLTDYCGSGNQAANFARTFTQNRTIASWISWQKLKIEILTYSSSSAAKDVLDHTSHTAFTTLAVAKSIATSGWSDDQRRDIESLCKRYAHPDSPLPPLGYKDSFGLYLTNLRVPNNLPQILIRSDGPFPGLFADRDVPDSFYAELASYHPEPDLYAMLGQVGAEDLADELRQATRPMQGLRALVTLALLDYGVSHAVVYQMLELGDLQLKELRTSLVTLGLIDLQDRVTKRGRQEINRARKVGFKPRKYRHVPSKPVDYVPSRLR